MANLQSSLDAKQDDLTGTSDVPGLDAALAGKQASSEKGQANGYAELDSSGKVPASQLPTSGGGASNLDDLGDVTLGGERGVEDVVQVDGEEVEEALAACGGHGVAGVVLEIHYNS